MENKSRKSHKSLLAPAVTRRCRPWPGSTTLQSEARLAQSAERKALNLVVVGSSPTVGACVHGITPAMPNPCPSQCSDRLQAAAG